MPTTKTIKFDDITTQPSAAIPDGYEGFIWVAFDPLNGTYGGDVYAATGGKALTSGTHSVKGLGFQMKLKEAGTFDVKSAVLAADSGFADGGANMDVTVVGRLADVEICKKGFNSSTGYGQGPTEVEINCNGLDEVVIFASAIETFDVDNIVVTVHTAAGEGGCDPSESFLCCLFNCFRRLFKRS